MGHSSSTQITAMEQCKQEQGLVTCSSLIPFCFYRCAVHGNEMISSSKHLSSERQTSFSQMHPSDKTCRVWAAGNRSESYFWMYYNQPYQLISYLQHINGEGKDKYIKTCHGNLKMVGVFSLKEKKKKNLALVQLFLLTQAVQLGLYSWKISMTCQII